MTEVYIVFQVCNDTGEFVFHKVYRNEEDAKAYINETFYDQDFSYYYINEELN